MMDDSSSSHDATEATKKSCQKCVQVLRDLVTGLQETDKTRRKQESAPLTLLKAIAKGADSSQSSSQGSKELQVEMIEDGVKVQLPVLPTVPTMLRRYSTWMQEEASGDVGLGLPLATSSKNSEEETPSASSKQPGLQDPLTVELKCRQCATTGPEAGARAFLMGPQPLSVVLCHNRIQSQRHEIEEILTHELVHLYDVQTLQLDLQQCENLAYSEVRAAKAAECRDSWHPHLQSYCVKQKAICATHNLFPREGRKCIQTVFSKAFGDNRPFPDKVESKTTSTR